MRVVLGVMLRSPYLLIAFLRPMNHALAQCAVFARLPAQGAVLGKMYFFAHALLPDHASVGLLWQRQVGKAHDLWPPVRIQDECSDFGMYALLGSEQGYCLFSVDPGKRAVAFDDISALVRCRSPWPLPLGSCQVERVFEWEVHNVFYCKLTGSVTRDFQ